MIQLQNGYADTSSQKIMESSIDDNKGAEGDAQSEVPFRPKRMSVKGNISEAIKENLVHQNSGASDSFQKDSQSTNVPKTAKEQQKPKGKGKLTGSKAAAVPSSNDMAVLPDFIVERNKLFDELKRQHDAEVLGKDHPEINVTLDLGLDSQGNQRPLTPVFAKAWESTPGSFLRHVDKDVSSDVVIAKVDGKELWDLDRPLEYPCQVSYLPFTSAEGRNVFWHSSAHVLGEAAECQYKCLLSHGPPVEQGFFYDMALPEGYATMLSPISRAC